MEKTTHFIEKVWEPIPQVFPIRWVLLNFLMLWKICGENRCISHVMKYTRGRESNGKNVHTMGKVWVPISQVFRI